MATKAIILAAGAGTRLSPHTKETSKCLLEVAGKSILSRQLGALDQYGIKNIAIVVGYKKDLVILHALDCLPDANFQFIVNENFATTNTLYSLALVAEQSEIADNVIQLNGDVVFDHEILGNLLRRDDNKSYAVTEKKLCGDEEIKVIIGNDGRITDIGKSINPALALGEAVGINKFNGRFWELFKKNLLKYRDMNKGKYFEHAMQESIRDGGLIYPLQLNGMDAVEIDFIEDLVRAILIFQNK